MGATLRCKKSRRAKRGRPIGIMRAREGGPEGAVKSPKKKQKTD